MKRQAKQTLLEFRTEHISIDQMASPKARKLAREAVPEVSTSEIFFRWQCIDCHPTKESDYYLLRKMNAGTSFEFYGWPEFGPPAPSLKGAELLRFGDIKPLFL